MGQKTVPSTRNHLPKVLSTVSLMVEVCMLIASVRYKMQGKGGEGAGEGFIDMDPRRANVTRRG